MLVNGSKYLKLSSVAILILSSSLSHSAGFALNDHSATASGSALAGAAASDTDISFSYWNPALFLNTTKSTIYASGALIIPSTEVEVTEASTASATGGLDLGTDTVSNYVDETLIPALYFARPLSVNTVAGVSLNTPFGLSGDYGDDWSGRFHATESSIQDIALSFTLAHRMNQKLSLGGSLQLHQAEVVLGSAVGSTNSAAGGEGTGYIEAEATGYGYSLGVLFEPVQGTRIGLGYRSKVDFDFEGSVTYSGVSSTLAALASLEDTTVTDSLTFPSLLTISLDQHLSNKLTLGLTAMKTGWDVVDELRIDYDSNQSDSVVTFSYTDQWFYSAGLSYDYSDKWVLRTGVAVDQSPATDEYRSARAPDGDRYWFTLGGTYIYSGDTTLNFSYAYVEVEDVSIARGDADEDSSRGNLSADYESSVHIISLALNTSF
ncbi:outer membrane protein transport protein [Marinomonas sp. C2222]|uniref:Outer membrane protein transport protein n=1 Tax=Marinomonas sargassi TaxID=2984494 RepID=A0ABT2YRU8_9GAMM|nr:outer membrane protein transport protein [Marinomonas sargassi]MCV2402619.1 outer membrane protein transport protein [Marinomonas sargassi]